MRLGLVPARHVVVFVVGRGKAQLFWHEPWGHSCRRLHAVEKTAQDREEKKPNSGAKLPSHQIGTGAGDSAGRKIPAVANVLVANIIVQEEQDF